MTHRVDGKGIEVDIEALGGEGPSKVSFTVSIQKELDMKFNEIWSYYQAKHRYGKVYKHQVIQLIIDEVHTKMKSSQMI